MKVVYTIGHSNRDFQNFFKLLKQRGIDALIDIRRFPSSKFPQFSGENLKYLLKERGIEYFWIPELGGYKKRILKESPNTAIRTEGFRNYADYMLTEQFERDFERLRKIIDSKTSALMCAEKFFWRCHRKFLSDFLVLQGYKVLHIIDEEKIVEHKLSREARVDKGKLIYDLSS